MYTLLIFTLLFSYLNLSQSQCPITCNTTTGSLNCYVTNASPELEDSWIESCYDTSSMVQILNIFITDYQNSTFPINSQPNLTINNIIIHFYQSESLLLNSSSYNSNISSLTLYGSNSFRSGLRDFLSHFPNLISLYIMNNTLLRDIEDMSFVSLTRLQILTVEGVGIERIRENLFEGLSNLIRLEWTYSNTSVIESAALYHLTSLRYLNLQNNRITSIPDSLFRRYLPNLEHISLASNQLRTVPYQAFEQSPLISLLRLDYNPLNCNCDLYWMYYAMLNYNFTITLSCAQNYTCNQTSPCYTTPTFYTTAVNTSQISTDCNDEDIYECLSPSQPCQHICTNSPTGFNCSCDEGYISFCSNSPCCISSVYSCPINLTETLRNDTVVQVSPIQLPGNRSVILSSGEDQITLNLSISVSSHVLVVSCQVDWQECVATIVSMTLSESFSLAFSLPSVPSSPLHYLLLRVEETESGSVQLYERLLVVIQSSHLPTLYTRSLVTSSVSSDVLIGVAVSSLEPSLCSEVCPALSVSLFSVGLIDVDISEWEGVSVRLVSCVSLPSQHWMSYSSYLFSIEWRNVSSVLNGRYELRVNGSGLVAGVAEFSIDYPVADNACEGRLEMGVYWNWTSNGTTSTVPCYELFGQHKDIVYSNSSQTLSSSCGYELEWESNIASECFLSGENLQILVFSAELVPSNRYFVSLEFNSTFYLEHCLSRIISNFKLSQYYIYEMVTRDNFVFYKMDVTNISIDDILYISNQDLFDMLNAKLDTCLLDYSIDLFVRSTKCRCDIERSLDRNVLTVYEMCHLPACSCEDNNCSCIGTNDYIGSGANCSYDSDRDGYPDHRAFCVDKYCLDNCPFTPNPVQEDCDDNDIGDACTSYLDFDPDIVTLMNRSIVVEPGIINLSLNLTLSHNSNYTVSVQSCEVGWIECNESYLLTNISSSVSGEIELNLDSEWTLNYFLLSISHHGNDSRVSTVRLLVISQNLTVPEFQSRSFVSGDRVWVGVSVSSCTSECPYLSSSLWSVGLRDVNISGMTDYISFELDYCEFLPSVHWFGFSSYVYSISVKQPTNLLNGRYKFNVTGDNIRGESTFQLLYVGLENACSDELSFGLYWNWTYESASQTIDCSQLMGEYGAVDNINLTISRSCETDFNFSPLSAECSFDGDGDKFLMFSVILNPSNLFFSSLNNATLKHSYINDCLNLVQSEFNFLDFYYLEMILHDNRVYFRFNSSNYTTDVITSLFTRDWFKQARIALSNCVNEFSLTNFVQSLKCNCIHDSSNRDPDQVSIVEICHRQACSCGDNNCSCIGTNDYIGSGANCSYDSDRDGYPDHRAFCVDKYCLDNCPFTYNPVQEDCDDNGIGDACTSYLDFDPDIVTLMNRSIVVEPGIRNLSLNLTLSHNSNYTVSVQSCEVGWIECNESYLLTNISSSVSGEIELNLDSEWTLNYFLLSISHHGNDSRVSTVRLLVISQNLTVPEFQSRSFVSGDRVWVGVSVSSCTSECPYLSSSLWSVGLRDVNISGMTDYISFELDYCEFLPSVHWFGFSSYVYSISVKQPTNLLNGRYKFNVTGDNIRGESTFQLLYVGLENACESELDLGLYWNWTRKGDTLSIPCSNLFGKSSQHSANKDLMRVCGADGDWSGISGQCAFNGSTEQVMVITSVLNPSNRFFLSQYFPEVVYADVCLDVLMSNLSFEDSLANLDDVYIDNIAYFRLDATLASALRIENISNEELVPFLNKQLETCIDDYSIYLLNQSTICECNPNTTEAVRESVNFVNLCDKLACSCGDLGEDCKCTKGFYGDGVECSYDTDEDGLPDHPVLCDGTTPCKDKCPFHSRCFPSEDIPEYCEEVCPEEIDKIFNLTWPCSSVGAKRYVDCPEGNTSASRICSPLGIWGSPDTRSCVSERFAGLTGNASEQLSQLVSLSPSVTGDVTIALDIVTGNSETIIGDTEFQKVIIYQTANIVSNLVQPKNRALLEVAQEEVPVVQQILGAIDNLVSKIGTKEDVKLNESANVYIETKQLVADSESDDEIQLIADNIKIGDEEESPSITFFVGSSIIGRTTRAVGNLNNRTISFVVIKNLGNLLSNYSEFLKFGSAGISIDYFRDVSIVSPIVQVRVLENGTPVEEINVDMTIPIDYEGEKNTYYRPICAYIHNQDSDNPQIQQEVNDTTPGNSVRVVDCHARRSASFVVLVGINNLAGQSIVLNIISYAGCSLSTICLTISISIYILFGYRLLKKIYHFVHFNLAISLLITYLVFLVGLESPYVNVLEYIPCKVVSALMQYILLVMFLWMLMEGVVIFIMIYFPLRKFTKKFFVAFFCISWISPLLYVLAISPWFHPYLISPPYFGSTQYTNTTNITLTTNNATTLVNPTPGFCWIHNDEDTNLIFAVTVPILLIIIINILIFVTVSIRCILLIRKQKSVHLLARSQKIGLRLFILSLVLFPLLGFGWTFGLIAIISHVAVFAWIFTILGSGQGILILFFVILIRKDIRLSILRALNLKAKLSSLSTKITSQFTRQTTAAPPPVPEVDFSVEPTQSRFVIYHGKDPYAQHSLSRESDSQLSIGDQIENQRQLLKTKQDFNIEMDQLELGLLNFEKAVAEISDIPTTPSDPPSTQVLEEKTDQIPTLKPVVDRPRKRKEFKVLPQILESDLKEKFYGKDVIHKPIENTLFPLIDSELSMGNYTQAETVETVLPSQDDLTALSMTDSLRILTGQLDDLLTDFDIFNTLPKY